MNGIDKISERILSDARAEADTITAQADERAAQVCAEYEQKIRAEQDRLARQAQAEGQKRLERAQGASRMTSRRTLLETKQALVDKTFRQAEKMLLELPEEDYAALCAQLAAEASVTGSEELIFSASDRARIGVQAVQQANARLQAAGKPAALTLADETRELRGGVVLRNGLVETNCCIGTLVESLRPVLSGQVAATLFG